MLQSIERKDWLITKLKKNMSTKQIEHPADRVSAACSSEGSVNVRGAPPHWKAATKMQMKATMQAATLLSPGFLVL